MLNASETNELIFGFKLRYTCKYPIYIDAKTVEIVKKYNYLGVLIDYKLKWSELMLMHYTVNDSKGYSLLEG